MGTGGLDTANPTTQDQESRYLLIIGCSQRKRRDPGLLPAIERYDGVNFRVLRKAKREGYCSQELDVVILSARYGLVRAETPIEWYDMAMTRERAIALQRQVGAEVDQMLRDTEYAGILVNLGRTYHEALAGSRELRHQAGKVAFVRGGIGEKMSSMKRWLQSLSAS
jgi:cytoplasmic iron level regulating protein YaaA (DUF328/UPF0246 family)